MSWVSEAFTALKKIILLEERVSQLAGRVDGLGRLLTEMDRRLIRLETRMELSLPPRRRRRAPPPLPE